MENVILKSLAFDLTVPTVLSFLERCEKSVDLSEELMEKFSHLTKVGFHVIQTRLNYYNLEVQLHKLD